MYLVTSPDHHAYFESHGLPEIERRMKITTILLYTRVTVMFVTSALLIIWMWRFEIIAVINGAKTVLSGRLFMPSQLCSFFLTFIYSAEYRLPWYSSRCHCWYSNAVSDCTPSNDRNPRAGTGEEGWDSAMPSAGGQSSVCEKKAPKALNHQTIVIVQRGLMLLVSSPK
jgi:hypothetical protein